MSVSKKYTVWMRKTFGAEVVGYSHDAPNGMISLESDGFLLVVREFPEGAGPIVKAMYPLMNVERVVPDE